MIILLCGDLSSNHALEKRLVWRVERRTSAGRAWTSRRRRRATRVVTCEGLMRPEETSSMSAFADVTVSRIELLKSSGPSGSSLRVCVAGRGSRRGVAALPKNAVFWAKSMCRRAGRRAVPARRQVVGAGCEVAPRRAVEKLDAARDGIDLSDELGRRTPVNKFEESQGSGLASRLSCARTAAPPGLSRLCRRSRTRSIARGTGLRPARALERSSNPAQPGVSYLIFTRNCT